MTLPLLPAMTILNKHALLKDNQFYHVKTNKTAFGLHHTSGGSATSSISWWNQKPDHVCTPIMIPRNGEIWELFSTHFWAYALGRTSYGVRLEKRSIQFEIANWGGLIKGKDGRFYTWSGKVLPASKVIKYKKKHRGFLYFEKYTDKQVKAVVFALDHYAKMHNIKIKPEDLFQFWHKGKKPYGIYSHTTVRGDKSDIHPQPNLIKAIYDHFGCTGKITE